MADLRFSFEVLQELIDTFGNIKEDFSVYGSISAASIESDDPVARHHGHSVIFQESALFAAAVEALEHAQEGAQSAYNDFLSADMAEAPPKGEPPLPATPRTPISR